MEGFAELLSVVGPKDINVRSGIKLEDRWKDEEGSKRAEEINDFYAMGQNLTLKSVPDVIDALVYRDYSELANYNGKKRLGAIMVPDSYNPARPNMVYVNKDSSPAGGTINDCEKAIGDMAERSVYEVLKSTFTHKKFKGSVLVIQGLTFLQINPKQRQRKLDRELDFLVIHKELSCVINIEVKNYLGYWQRPKVNQQLIENHQFFEDWFGADISPKWTWISMVYSEKALPEELSTFITNNDCADYIASGRQDLKSKILKILSRNQFNTPVSEFKMICKYLLFCLPTKPLPIGINQVRQMDEAIEKQGSVENIKVWCFPTPEQRRALTHNKVFFIAPWGSGKTMLMVAKAIELAESGQDVLFLVFHDKMPNIEENKLISLLCIQLQLKLKSYSRIKVLPIWAKELSRIGQIAKGYNHVMLDEFPGLDWLIFNCYEGYEVLPDFIKSKETLWMSISGNYSVEIVDLSEDIVDNISRSWFQGCGFTFVRMKLTLRSPQKITEFLKNFNRLSGRVNESLNYILLNDTEFPPMMTEGKVVKLKIKDDASMTDYLRQCLAHVPKGTYAMITIHYGADNFIWTQCKDCKKRVLSELFDSAFIQLGEKPPIHYTNHFQSPTKDIEDWLINADRHLVVSSNFAIGFQHSTVINLSGASSSSRSAGTLIIPAPVPRFPNLAYLALPIESYINMEKHDCQHLYLAGLDSPLDVIDRVLYNKSLARVAVYTHSSNVEYPVIPAVLHYSIVGSTNTKSAIKSILGQVLNIYEGEVKCPAKEAEFHDSFFDGDFVQNLLNLEVWVKLPNRLHYLNECILIECLARIIQRQIMFITVRDNMDMPVILCGHHLPESTRLFVLRFQQDRNSTFYVTAVFNPFSTASGCQEYATF